MAKSRVLQRETAPKRDVRLLELWLTLRGVVWWILHGLYRTWKLNPISLLRHRIRKLYKLGDGSDLPIKPRWTEFVKDIFTSDMQRKIRLLQWVRSRVDHVTVEDFIFSWHDGIALCALLESVCPGVCPNYRLLRSDLQVNSCRFALQVAHKFLGIQKIILTPEEMAIADQSTEIKIVHLVQMIRWKHQRMSATAIANSEVKLPVRRVISRCFARGAGLKSGMVGRGAKFNIFADTNGILEVLVEIRGPNGEMNSEKISTLALKSETEPSTNSVRLKPPKLQFRSKVITDESGNTFIRQKSFDEHSNEVIPFDYQSQGEGRFLVTYIPRNSGIHIILIKSHNHHIQGSPFEANISDCESPWKVVRSNKVRLGSTEDVPPKQKELENLVSKRFLVAGSERARRQMGDLGNKYKVKRRILKKVITRNGEETSLSDFSPSPSLSRQSSTEYSDVSEELKRSDSSGDLRDKRKKFHLIKQDIYLPDETSNDTSDSLSVLSTDSAALTSLDNSVSGSEAAFNLTGGIHKYPNPKRTPRMKDTLVKAMFRRSLSDSMLDDINVLYEDVTKPLKEGQTSLKMLKSKSSNTKCFYVNNSTVFESTASPPSSFSVSSKPSLAEVQKMTRKWQSMDLADVDLTKHETIVLDSPERSMPEQNSSLQEDLVVLPNDDVSKGQDKSGANESPTTFKCIDSRNQTNTDIKLKHVNIAFPKAKIDKTTQVSATEIKEATGWHSGAFKIKKRRIRIYPSTQDKSRRSLMFGNDNPEVPHSNEYNIHQWLQRNGREPYNLLEDRQSTVDTSDSGIADETFQKQHQNTRQRQASTQSAPLQDGNRDTSQNLQIALAPVDTNGKNYSNRSLADKSSMDELKDQIKRAHVPEELYKTDTDKTHQSDNVDSKHFDERATKDSRSENLRIFSIDRVPPEGGDDILDTERAKPSISKESTTQRENRLNNYVEDNSVHAINSLQLMTGMTSMRTDDLTRGDEMKKKMKELILTEEFSKDEELMQKQSKEPRSTKDFSKDLTTKHKKDTTQIIENSKVEHGKVSKKDSVDTFFDKLLSAHSLQSMEEMLETNPFTETDQCLSPAAVSEENCLAFGAGLSFGHVGIKNNFQVWVRDDKEGSVSVSVCGPRPNCVTETTTLYTGDNLYEIFYQVTHPGYYVITVKYALNSVPNSPFIAKVAWD